MQRTPVAAALELNLIVFVIVVADFVKWQLRNEKKVLINQPQ